MGASPLQKVGEVFIEELSACRAEAIANQMSTTNKATINRTYRLKSIEDMLIVRMKIDSVGKDQIRSSRRPPTTQLELSNNSPMDKSPDRCTGCLIP